MDRFWAKVDKSDPDGCWLWTAAKNNNGYGVFQLGTHREQRLRLAHVVAYELVIGPIPAGFELDHVAARGCTNRHCVRPDHLEPVTHAENMWRSRLTHCKRGHELSGDNLSPTYGCKACNRLRAAKARRMRNA